MNRIIAFLVIMISFGYQSFSQCELSVSQISACRGTQIQFSIPSNITFSKIKWVFGDGDSSMQPTTSINHLYDTFGIFTASVTLFNSDKTIKCGPSYISITIFDNPQANFLMEKQSKTCKGFCFKDISLPGKSGAPIITHLWDFGDGDTALWANPCHYYIMDGIYGVFKLSKDTNGCMDTISSFRISYNPMLFPNFTALPKTNCEGKNVKFINTTDTNDQCITNFEWDFGDNTGWHKNNSDTVDWTYSQAGDYTIMLKASSCFGCTVINMKVSFVRIVEIKADFDTAEWIKVCAPQYIKFLDKSVSTGDQISERMWDFYNGIGSSRKSTLIDPIHTYQRNGSFNVRLIITTKTGCVDTIMKENYIEITGPQPKFWLLQNGQKVYSDTIVMGQSITVLDSSLFTKNWQFINGDKTIFSDTIRPANHHFTLQYKKQGTYRIYLNATLKVYFPIPAPGSGFWGYCTSSYGDTNQHPDDPTFTVVVKDTNTSIVEKSEGLILFPNPANDFIQLKMESPLFDIEEAIVYNVFGQKVLEIDRSCFQSTNCMININELNEGVYFLNIGYGGKRINIRFVVIK